MASWTDIHSKGLPSSKAYSLKGSTGLALDHTISLIASGREVSRSESYLPYPIDNTMCVVLDGPVSDLPLKGVQGTYILTHPLKQKGVTPIDLSYPTGPAGARDMILWIEREWKVPKNVSQEVFSKFSDLDSLLEATIKWVSVTSMIPITGQAHLEKLLPIVMTERDSLVERIIRKSPKAWNTEVSDCTLLLQELSRYLSTMLLIVNNTTPDKEDITIARDTRMRYTDYMSLKPTLSFYSKDKLRNLLAAVDALTPFGKMPECFRILEMLWH